MNFKAVKAGRINGFVGKLVCQMCTETEWQFGLINPGYDEILPFVRLDCLRVKNRFMIVDINFTRPAGVGDEILLSQAYKSFGFERQAISLGRMFCKCSQSLL